MQQVNIFWLRRDLRLHDNAALYHALKSGRPVLCLFIFDTGILDKLEDKADARVTFIYQTIVSLSEELNRHGSGILVKYDNPANAWAAVLSGYDVGAVYTNHDYEPYAIARDATVKNMLLAKQIPFYTFKDQVIFDRDEVLKDDDKPYTVFTPYKRKWYQKLKPFYLKPYPSEQYFGNLFKTAPLAIPSLKDIGFEAKATVLPDKQYYKAIIADYANTRDYPALKGTSRIGLHLRFGTVSIRRLAAEAYNADDKTWLNELIWREFYSLILYHFPSVVDKAFKPEYDRMEWRNNELEFNAWCSGNTGYPLVDAGMRELNATGFMHNRLRMVTASFLSKHLLVDWRWGERYFAARLSDYDMASNVGGWQWAAGCGNDAAPYFRIFNPELQMKRFDPKMEYVKKWVPEYADFSKYPSPIVNHVFARERCLKAFKAALSR